MKVAAFGVRKPVVANLVMFAIVVAGIIFGTNLRREFFPEVRPTQILVSAPYPGASPDEVEDSLAIKIEDRIIENVDGIEEINTTVTEGGCSIAVEFEDNIDITQALLDVTREKDALQDLPEETENITVQEFEPNLPTINISLYGEADERLMKDAIRDIQDDLRSLDGMGTIAVSGVRTDEITVEVRPEALIEHRLSLTDVTDRIRRAMVELPGGAIRTPTLNTALRTMGAAERVDAVRNIIVKATPDGQALRVRDVATVTDGFADVDIVSRLNGKPSASLTIFKVGDDDAVAMAEMCKAYVAGRRGEDIAPTFGERIALAMQRLANSAAEGQGRPVSDAPVSDRMAAYQLGLAKSHEALPGELTTTTDLSRFIVGRLELLSRNALQGGVLVLITLVLLLNWRVAFWVAIGLLVALLGTLTMMTIVGISLNLLTMFGLIIVIGLLVDDAIVVAENITARHEAGEPALDAAVNGTNQVHWPVVATVITTICAFLPLKLIEGSIGDLLGVLPVVVACALLVSLLECLFILPSHMGHSLVKAERAKREGRLTFLGRIESKFDLGREALFHRFIIPAYTAALRACLNARYLTLIVAIGAVIVSMGMVQGGRVPFVFIGSDDAETLNVELRMPVGTPIEATDPAVRRLEQASIAQPEVTAVFAQIGSLGRLDGSGGSTSAHLAQLILELAPVEDRDRSSEEVILSIQNAVGDIPGIKSLRIEGVSGGPEGPAITFAVTGDNGTQIRRAADDIKALLREFDGVYGVADDDDAGRRELQLTLRDGADELGFTVDGLARQVRAASFGLEAHTFAGEREDVDVRVTLPRETRRSLTAIENMYVFTPDGRPVPLREVASLSDEEGYATLRRLDRQRVVTVTAEVDRAVANTEQIAGEMKPALLDLERSYPGVEILERGRQKDVADSFATLPLGMLVATGLIYVVLAWLFSSYIQPMVVLMAIPFATIGMIWGHFLLGFDLTILSLIGFIALAGVVVNDSLIFMEFFNERHSEGQGVRHAAISAGRARIRAILLTTITTVFGLLPLMLEQSFQARFLIPMAITIAGGLTSATVIILIVIPCLLLILEDIKAVAAWLWHGRRLKPQTTLAQQV
jgi:HAE1 family hydrophobic/amphiphilic exporter-1